jgi:hypothetical protein
MGATKMKKKEASFEKKIDRRVETWKLTRIATEEKTKKTRSNCNLCCQFLGQA